MGCHWVGKIARRIRGQVGVEIQPKRGYITKTEEVMDTMLKDTTKQRERRE